MFIEYSWLIPLVPLLAFIIVGLIGKKYERASGIVAITGALIAFALSILVSYEYFTDAAWANHGPYTATINWMTIGGMNLNFGIYIDSLTCLMMVFSSLISTLIFVYSIGYMHDQGKKRRRYFAEVSLFLASMLGLVMASNYLEMFIFWEVVGVCSYLLIGFWSFDHPEGDEAADGAARAAKKAFLVTRLGDVCIMAGLFVLLFAFNSLDYTTLFDPAEIAKVDPNMIILASLLLFGGVIGKSAQFPLHDWLPDAMAGPTTVSALIHAATMVKAGVYLVARSYPLFVQNPEVMLFVAVIGGVTALFAATMALNNMNIKRVLAYSTISQLGYMIMALGAGGYIIAAGMADEAMGYTAGVFHMMNHAFFKALLFLCAGSVIHAVGTEDMRQMGGLGKKMRITSLTMLIGSLSIAGFPLLSGFWSKDLILESVYAAFDGTIAYPEIIFLILFVMGLVTAFMTAFYMFRMWYMTFAGKPGPATVHSHGESPKSMTIPLLILAFFAIFSGYGIFLGLNDALTFNVITDTTGKVTEYMFGGHGEDAMHLLEEIFTNIWTYVSIAVALIGILVAYLMYVRRRETTYEHMAGKHSGAYNMLTKRYGFPKLYDSIAMTFGFGVAKVVDAVDRQVVDGTVNGIANAITNGSESLSKAQTGYVRNYAGVVALGVIALVIVLFGIFWFMGGI